MLVRHRYYFCVPNFLLCPQLPWVMSSVTEHKFLYNFKNLRMQTILSWHLKSIFATEL